MTPRSLRRLHARLNAQIERERNGAPIDPEIEAHLTRPDDRRAYQVYVIANGRPTPVGFRGERAIIEEFAAAIRAEIKAGREKTWKEPLVVRV